MLSEGKNDIFIFPCHTKHFFVTLYILIIFLKTKNNKSYRNLLKNFNI